MSEFVIVTRHPDLVQLIRERGLAPEGAAVVEHASPEDVAGKHVIGVLPLRLAALAASVTEIPLALTPDLRGRELDIETLRRIAGEPTTYVVQSVWREVAPAVSRSILREWRSQNRRWGIVLTGPSDTSLGSSMPYVLPGRGVMENGAVNYYPGADGWLVVLDCDAGRLQYVPDSGRFFFTERMISVNLQGGQVVTFVQLPASGGVINCSGYKGRTRWIIRVFSDGSHERMSYEAANALGLIEAEKARARQALAEAAHG